MIRDGTRLEVVGRGAVTVVDGQHLIANAYAAKRTAPLLVSGAVLHVLPAGSEFDLAARTLIAHQTPVPDHEVVEVRAAEADLRKLAEDIAAEGLIALARRPAPPLRRSVARGSEDPVSSTVFNAVEHPDPAVLDVGPGERAVLETAVHEPDPGQALARGLDQSTRPGPAARPPARRVVEDVPGLDEPPGRPSTAGSISSITPSMAGRPSAQHRPVGLAGDRRLDEGRGVEVAAGPRRVGDRGPHLLRRGGDEDLVDVRGDGPWRPPSSWSGAVAGATWSSRSTRAAVNGAAYLLIQRWAIWAIGTGLR